MMISILKNQKLWWYLRPTAITSPTLFMELPILALTWTNLLRSQRGIFTTQ